MQNQTVGHKALNGNKAPHGKNVRLLVQGGGHSAVITGPADPLILGLRVVGFSQRHGVQMSEIRVTCVRELRRK